MQTKQAMTDRTPLHRERNFGLDLLRALAITMVFLSHGTTAFGNLNFGVGVDLFFVLSGFLIGRIYFRAKAECTFSLWRFWLMRWCRTLPPYYAALLLYALASLHFPLNPVRLSYVLFLQNYTGITGFSPSWSLCVEEHFYLVLPLLGELVYRFFGRRSFLWILPVATLAPMALRFTFCFSRGGLPINWFWMTHFHSEGLTFGVLLAYLFVHYPSAWQKLRPLAIVLSLVPGVMIVALYLHPITNLKFNAVIFYIWAIGFAGLLRSSYDLRWRPTRVFTRSLKMAIQQLALCSYSIYLVHVLVFTDLRLLFGNFHRGPLKSGIILLSALFVGIAFYFLVEKTSLDLRDVYLVPYLEHEKKAPVA